MKKVLYLSYTGLLEPLGRSQILAYLFRLSSEFQFTIVSFEKKEDFTNHTQVTALKNECARYGIDWQPKLYHQHPRFLATLWDLWMLFYVTFLFSIKGKAQLVHCRSYIPAIAAWVSGKFTRTPFIFDMRALWLEEMIEAGRLQRGSLMHKALSWFEKRLLHDAAHVVSLTQVAVDYLQKENAQLAKQNFSVITTCVDLNNFYFSEQGDGVKETSQQLGTKLGTIGTVDSGWFYLDWLFLTFQCELKRNPQAQFKIITRDSKQHLINKAKQHNVPESCLEIYASKSQDIAKHIQDIKAGLLYFTPGLAKLGSAPTRMGEFLACGIPVIGNRGVGDMADLIEKYQVGVVIENGSVDSLNTALVQLDILLQESDLKTRCREAAEDYFSADKGAKKYRNIYMGLV